ncbi:uncharacterized protein J3D65DRAFT_656844 [Phyllosticta citribraziliensis]|uniref:Secreted protein n=1 Tax=Phyllosticta citribraziliensis TaxID=989973 RepID=A0ABR1M2K4_9PEZI
MLPANPFALALALPLPLPLPCALRCPTWMLYEGRNVYSAGCWLVGWLPGQEWNGVFGMYQCMQMPAVVFLSSCGEMCVTSSTVVGFLVGPPRSTGASWGQLALQSKAAVFSDGAITRFHESNQTRNGGSNCVVDIVSFISVSSPQETPTLYGIAM